MTSLLQTSSKMKELEYALMTTESAGLVQLPIHLVRIAATDNDHNAWFVIPRPSQQTAAFGDNISARLDFYKKGKPYFLCVQGTADIITDVHGIPDTEDFQSIRTMVWKQAAAAVRVKIDMADIFGETVQEKPGAAKGFSGTLASVYAWLFSPVMSA